MFKILKQLHYTKLVYINKYSCKLFQYSRKFNPMNVSMFTIPYGIFHKSYVMTNAAFLVQAD